MVFLELLEVLTAIFIIAMFTTQIFMPLWLGGKLFPFCRKKLKRLDKEIAEAKEEIDIASAERKVKRIRKVAAAIRKEDEDDVGQVAARAETETEQVDARVERKSRVRKPHRKDETK
jgi:hypothetical protein